MPDLKGGTIVALATPAGRSALAVIRISGGGTADVLRRVGVSQRTLENMGRQGLERLVHPEDGSVLDQAVVVFQRGPGSYTGEDLAEVTVHGGRLGPEIVVGALVRAGARRAEAGEFTRRRWAAGKMDRLQVEGLAVLLDAETQATRKMALGRLEGGLSQRLASLRSALLQVEVALAHHLDFPDEDDPPTPVSGIVERVHGVRQALGLLEASAPVARRLREGALVVLAGRPNAGKSSLFNAWMGEERVLVSPVEGTTRDAIEETVVFGGVPARLLDTAGLRETADGVEASGIEMSARWLGAADVIVWLHRASWGAPTIDEVARMTAYAKRDSGRCVLLPVMSCLDEASASEMLERGSTASWEGVDGEAWLPLSLHQGVGMHDLRARIEEVLGGGLVDQPQWADGCVLVRAEEATAVRTARDCLVAAEGLLTSGLGAELAALEVRTAREALEGMVGVIQDDEVLDALFSGFCIGK